VLGEGISLRPALEKLGLQRILQRRDAAGDRRVVGPEPSRRHREPARPRHGEEEAKVVPVEAIHALPPPVLVSLHVPDLKCPIVVRE